MAEFIPAPSLLAPFKPSLNMRDPHGILRLGLSENSRGATAFAIQAVLDEVKLSHRYPDASADDLCEAIGERLGVDPRGVVVGNGIDELLLFVALTFLHSGRIAVVTANTYAGHAAAVAAVRSPCRTVPLRGHSVPAEAINAELAEGNRVVLLCNPHNPTGTAMSGTELDRVATTAQASGSLLVVDEAYVEFGQPDRAVSALGHVRAGKPVIVLRTFSKIFGLAGLRCGYALCPPPLADQLRRIKNVTVYNVNRYALAAALATLRDPGAELGARTAVRHSMDDFLAAVAARSWMRATPSATNFLFCELDWEADIVAAELVREAVLVRSCSDLGFPRHIRVSVGTSEEMSQLLAALDKVAVRLANG